jgi:HD-like signal output (HDOD) protein
VLEEFVDIDVNTDAVARIVSRNQYFEYMLLQEIKTLGLKDISPSLQTAIALLGMQRVRDFICALQIMRIVCRKHPEFNQEGKLNFRSSEYLTYSLKTEEYVVTRRMQYADIAYAAGMVFDLMVWIGRELYGSKKGYDELMTEVYKHGLRAAMIGMEIAKLFKRFNYNKYVFAACLLHDVGKLAMDLIFGTAYSIFRADINKVPLSRDVTHFLEARRFGFTHEYYGSQMAYYFQIFRPIEKAILFHHEPYLLKGTNKELWVLASIIALASNMARNYRIPKDHSDPIFKAWFPHELKDFRIDKSALILIMNKIGRESF